MLKYDFNKVAKQLQPECSPVNFSEHLISSAPLHGCLRVNRTLSKCNLRYYATFKRKCESLFYKINTFLQKTTTWIGLQAEETFSANM